MCASCVELVTFDQMRQRYPQLEQHRIAPSGGAFCRAERLKGGGAAGTYAMPRPMAPTGEKHFFGFYLTQRRMTWRPGPRPRPWRSCLPGFCRRTCPPCRNTKSG